ncbi:hypothetical protein C4D60_Mb01t29220 [Musa balbisiana]|uniref:Uncharacterized protein n=1 Tax=Musa balbisiana TaxID=52838 RepID=A0A4S8JRJ9_MUSBA|nr:hypothetical protein C4D60_Mb01t29220 [Musa balbisiana]
MSKKPQSPNFFFSSSPLFCFSSSFFLSLFFHTTAFSGSLRTKAERLKRWQCCHLPTVGLLPTVDSSSVLPTAASAATGSPCINTPWCSSACGHCPTRVAPPPSAAQPVVGRVAAMATTAAGEREKAA